MSAPLFFLLVMDNQTFESDGAPETVICATWRNTPRLRPVEAEADFSVVAEAPT
ncbi:hypothetical protein [Janthinobacterium sp. FT14W]|uniref:hypothetical protein n=1 Tax=Janthinobacterium sp. FT14W TaxID=2654253 RepID=UPI00186ACB00|nr:hypothetical protein [Janthinobacterium sp. FT14W]